MSSSLGIFLKIKRESGPEGVSIYTGRKAQELQLCDLYQPKGVSVVGVGFGSTGCMDKEAARQRTRI